MTRRGFIARLFALLIGSIMAEKGVIFSRGDADRIARATKAIERMPTRLVGERRFQMVPTAIEIVGNKEKGVYTCKIGIPSLTTFDPETNDASFSFHSYPLESGETFNGYFVNKAEEGKTDPNWLDSGGHYYGFFAGVASDGLPIILGHTFDTEECVVA